jgi:lysyl-tRNA synthetase class 2
VKVGGRVVAVEGRTLVVADALAGVRVALTLEADADAGDLVVVSGRASPRGVLAARVVERHPGRAPGAESEFGRLALGRVGGNLAARALAFRVVRDYFDGEGFIEVDTAVRVPSPGLDAHVDAVRAEEGFLITSPELQMKRLLVGGLPRVYQLVHTSRAGEHGELHEPEFTMLEWYRAFSGFETVLRDTEAIVSAVVRRLSGGTVLRTAAGRRLDVRPPFPRTTVRDAFKKHAGVADAVDLAATDETRFFELLVDRVEPALARSPHPWILHEFPRTQGALARPCSTDASVVERFEVYAAGIELSNGFGELTDPVEQRLRFEAEVERRRREGGRAQPLDERFLAALEEGLPPSGGNALGMDRLVALALGERRIADVMAFPRERL